MDFKRVDDETLIKEISTEGLLSEQAFEELVCRYRHRFLSFAGRVLRDNYLSEDAVQDAFLSIFQGASSFRGDSKVSTWLFGVLSNTCRHFKKKEQNSKIRSSTFSVGAPEDLDAFSAVNAKHNPVFFQVEARRDLYRVEKELGKLKGNTKDIFLFAVSGVDSYGDVSKKFGISVDSIKTQISRTRRTLRGKITLS